ARVGTFQARSTISVKRAQPTENGTALPATRGPLARSGRRRSLSAAAKWSYVDGSATGGPTITRHGFEPVQLLVSHRLRLGFGGRQRGKNHSTGVTRQAVLHGVLQPSVQGQMPEARHDDVAGAGPDQLGD